jgi:hypothetical protein
MFICLLSPHRIEMQRFHSNILFFLPALLGQWLDLVSFSEEFSFPIQFDLSLHSRVTKEMRDGGGGRKSRVRLASCSLRQQTGRKGNIAGMEVSEIKAVAVSADCCVQSSF